MRMRTFVLRTVFKMVAVLLLQTCRSQVSLGTACDDLCSGLDDVFIGEGCCSPLYCYCNSVAGNPELRCGDGKGFCAESSQCVENCSSVECCDGIETSTTTTTTTSSSITSSGSTSTTSSPSTPVPAGVCPDSWIESLEGCFLFEHSGQSDHSEVCKHAQSSAAVLEGGSGLV